MKEPDREFPGYAAQESESAILMQQRLVKSALIVHQNLAFPVGVFLHTDILRGYRFAAMATVQLGLKRVLTLFMNAGKGGAVVVRQILVSPLCQVHDHRVEIPSH